MPVFDICPNMSKIWLRVEYVVSSMFYRRMITMKRSKIVLSLFAVLVCTVSAVQAIDVKEGLENLWQYIVSDELDLVMPSTVISKLKALAKDAKVDSVVVLNTPWGPDNTTFVYRVALMRPSLRGPLLDYFAKEGGNLNWLDKDGKGVLVRMMERATDSDRNEDWYYINDLIERGAGVKGTATSSPLFAAIDIKWKESGLKDWQCELIKLLVRKGADINEVFKGETLLIKAIESGKDQLALCLLLNIKDIDLNRQDESSSKSTALHHAVRNPNMIRVVEHLFLYGADPDKQDALGKTADSYTKDKDVLRLFERARMKKAPTKK